MCTSDTETKKALKTSLVYLLLSLFCVLFGAVYELFSHEVYSFYMIYAFVFPLAGGALPFLIIALSRIKKSTGAIDAIGAIAPIAGNLYHSGIATFTVGSIIRGVLDIYGTTNRLLNIYWIIGVVLTAFGVVMALLRIKIISHRR